MTQAFPHDSILGGLNLLKRSEFRIMLTPGERPPYPIIIMKPSVKETFFNMNRADIGILFLYTLIGKTQINF